MENPTLPQNPKPNFVIWIAAGVVILSIGLGLGLALGKYSPKPDQSLTQPLVFSPTLPPAATPTEIVDSIANWETYTSTKVPELSYSAFSIKYPKSWVKSIEYFEPGKTSGYFTLYLTKGDYKISITQGATGGAMCLLDNEPDYNGPTVDYRQEIYTNINSPIGILRRVKSKSPNAFDICQDNRSKLGHFVLPTSVGGIGYKVPLSPSNQVLAEMDDVVKTIEAR